MDWNRLLSTRRLGKFRKAGETASDPRTAFTRDWDRIVFSSAFRRMQDKTQVFPLARSDYVRTRLTHSLEVASVGRSLGMQAADVILRKEPRLPISPHEIGAVVSTACLMHDIGNPPLGHAGEEAIQEWFAEQPFALIAALGDAQREDFLRFEGNAQGFRALCTLQYHPQRGGMQLTGAVLGAFAKYPRASIVDPSQAEGISGRKFGFMQAEAPLFDELADELGLVRKAGAGTAWHRHPLAFLVEAADDTCYHLMDVEDGFKAGVVTYEQLLDLYEPWLSTAQFDRVLKNPDRERQAEYLRALTVGCIIREAIAVFDANYDGLMSGAFDQELSACFDKAPQFRAFKELARRQVYTARPVVEVEACGFEVIGGLLSAFVGALQARCDRHAGTAIRRQFRSQTLLALLPAVPDAGADAYRQLLAVTDFVAGMTDSSAVELYQRISGISLP
ncbi:MAG: deoxyguanosinetriphosphate triphosphohydrolase [Burkholderiaceae bacterium]